MKLNQVKVQCIEGDSALALNLAITDWLATIDGEAQFLSLQFSIATGVFSVVIVYAT